MKACYTVIFIIQSATAANICSTNMVNLAVDNGLMSCFTNNTCIAECYRGYIFPSGNTKESYSCQNGNLTPMLSTCKRIPVVNVTYSAIWTSAEIVTSTCSNISSRLDNVKEVLEETLSGNCRLLNIKSTVMLTYSLFAFKVLKFASFKYMYTYNCLNIFLGILRFNIIFPVITVCSLLNMIL